MLSMFSENIETFFFAGKKGTKIIYLQEKDQESLHGRLIVYAGYL